MPGSRLTLKDRRRIATGLAEGLGYAEIARRLDRPTSTVSREVARNGGPGAYRPDHAHQATGWRARRRGPATPPGEPADEPHGRDPEAVRRFVERFTAVMVEAGLPRMAARVLACLFATDSASLTAAGLVRRLQVSPASVSKAIGYLEGLGMVRRERDARPRRERYLIEDDVWFGAWSASSRKVTDWAEAAREGVALLGPGTPAGSRMRQMSRFFAELGQDMSGGLGPQAAEDVLTLAAALVHAGRPLTSGRLAGALGWPPERVAAALDDARRHPAVADPIAFQPAGPDAYTFTVRPGRLTAAQREALAHA